MTGSLAQELRDGVTCTKDFRRRTTVAKNPAGQAAWGLAWERALPARRASGLLFLVIMPALQMHNTGFMLAPGTSRTFWLPGKLPRA